MDENEHYTDEELKDWEEQYYDYGSCYDNIMMLRRFC